MKKLVNAISIIVICVSAILALGGNIFIGYSIVPAWMAYSATSDS